MQMTGSEPQRAQRKGIMVIKGENQDQRREIKGKSKQNYWRTRPGSLKKQASIFFTITQKQQKKRLGEVKKSFPESSYILKDFLKLISNKNESQRSIDFNPIQSYYKKRENKEQINTPLMKACQKGMPTYKIKTVTCYFKTS